MGEDWLFYEWVDSEMVREDFKRSRIDTRDILWNMTWRAQFWGAFTGLVFGAVYGYLSASLILLPDLISRTDVDLQLKTLSLALTLGVLGIPIGGAIGLGFGWIVGLVGGVLIGFLTCRWFNPLADVRGYRSSIKLLSVGIVVIAGMLLILVINPWEFVPTGSINAFWNRVVLFVFPLIIAAIMGNWISQKLEKWYSSESSGVA